MGRALQGPHDALGHVRRGQRGLDARVDGVGGGPVPVEAVEGELLGGHHARRDLDDPHRLADQLQAQGVGDDALGVLGGDIAGAARVGAVGGGRGQEDDVAPALAQSRQEGPGDAQGRERVALVHGQPLGRVGVGHGVQAQRPAGVVDDRVDGAVGEDLGGQALDVVGTLEVGDDPGAAGLGGQGLQALDAAGGGDHVPSVGAQEADGGRANAGGGSGDQGAARGRPGVGRRGWRRTGGGAGGGRCGDVGCGLRDLAHAPILIPRPADALPLSSRSPSDGGPRCFRLATRRTGVPRRWPGRARSRLRGPGRAAR